MARRAAELVMIRHWHPNAATWIIVAICVLTPALAVGLAILLNHVLHR